MIPKGDFTKQKYIIGRVTAKDDEEENSTKTFNFKLPFDNFVGLENLMVNNPMLTNSYLANKPQDGRKDDLTDTDFLNRLSNTQYYNTREIEAAQTKLNNLQHNLSVVEEFYHEFSGRAIASLKAYIYPEKNGEGEDQTFFDALKDISITLASTEIREFSLKMFDRFLLAYERYSLDVKIPESDLNELWILVRAAFDKKYNILLNEYNQAVEEARASIDNLFDTEIYSSANKNHLWSWTRGDTKPVIETKLGISIDFKTLLGNFRPLSGDYGLRILITGRTKPTEEKNSEEITEEVYLKKSDMYGNVYAFYEPYTQQKIFDISHLLTLNRIDIFFWQDHNFVDYTGKYIDYQVNGVDLPANMFVNNLDVKLGLTVDECNTDRVFLYTYDDMYYGYDPLDPNATADDLNNTRTLQFAWVHIGPDGPVLVNHTDYYPVGNTKDTSALRYWQDNGGAQIQWYHFEYGCTQNATILAERQGGANWKYLGDYNGTVTTLVDDCGDDDPENDVYKTDYKDTFSIVVEPNVLKAKDRWKAVVSVGNVPYSTEPLIFTNIDTNVETEAFDTLNEVVFRILHEEFNDSANIYNIVEDSTLRDFYFYDINDTAIRNENNRLYSDIDYYLQVWIRNNETGEYSPMTYDPDEGLVDVVFQWPQNNTMIRDWSDVTDADLANATLAPILNGASAAYNDRIKAITRKFHIKQNWKASLNNNTISASVVRRNKTYHPTIQFNFGNASSMGANQVITVSQLMPASSMIIKDQPFAIEAIVRQKDGSHDPNSKYIFTWELLSPTVITQSGGETWTEGQPANWQVDNTNGYIGNVIRGYVRNDYPPIFKVTVRNAAEWDISQTAGFRLASHADVAERYIVNSCAERVEFKADGTVPISYYGTFSVEMLDNNERLDYWPTWSMAQMRKVNDSWTSLDEPDYFDLKSSPQGVKNVATNHNIGIYAPGSFSNPGLDGPFSLTQTSNCPTYFAYNDLYEAIINDYNQSIADTIGSVTDVAALLAEIEYTKTTRLNNLNIIANKALPSYTVYSFNPYVRNEAQAASWLWDNKLENYYTYIGFTTAEGYFRQAIPFTRNLYSSTLLNSWDGKLHLDEENNAVLSQMISAGTTSNGLFTGVVMGNWANVSDTSLDIPGLYGLKDGGQVFGFKTDGTGFIGKAGRGRITFDGNQSLISNIDHTSYINLDPIRYHFDGDKIVFDDYYGYSPYFLYSEVNKTSTASIVGEDSLEQSTYWAKRFMDDTHKDYFIVDPNNGILTTGGVIARYGKIGNWMISESGLYQKYTASTGTSTANRYMYLGYPGIDLKQVSKIKKEYEDLLDMIDQSREAAISDLKSQYQMEEFQVVGEYYANIFEYDPLHYYNYGWPYLIYSNVLTEVLLKTASDSSSELLRYKFMELFKEYVEKEERCGWHWHYTNGEKSGLPQYTGDYQAFQHMVMPLYIYEPYAPRTSDTCKQWADTGIYPEGTRRQVSYSETVDPYSPVADTYYGRPVGEGNPNISIEESVVGTNIPSNVQPTGYWRKIGTVNSHAYAAIYEYKTDGILIIGNISGYEQFEDVQLAFERLEDEVKSLTVIGVKANTSSPYYLIYNGIIYTAAGDTESGPPQQGETDGKAVILEELLPHIPQTIETYYTKKYPNNPEYRWDSYKNKYGLINETIPTFDLNSNTVQIIPDTDSFYEMWTRARVQEVRKYAIIIYSYYADAYSRQLKESLAAGLAKLTEEQLNDYYARKQQLEKQLADALIELNKKFDNLKDPILSLMNEKIKTLYDEDKDRYAIYCGYDAPTILNAKPPLFTVNWRGYMTARAGKIGYESPWYISDYGLTQTNNFGTIFLGNPEAPAEKTEWFDIGNDATNLKLLPNHDEDGSPAVLGASDNKISKGKFAIYAGNAGWVWSYDKITDKYTRSKEPEDKPTIKFGVRMDGTLYAITGMVGGWNLTQNMLYAGNTENPSDLLVLDANRGVISLGGAIVLQKDGTVTLGKMGPDGTSAGTINIAGVFFKGRSTDQVDYNIPTYSITSDGWIQTATKYDFWGSGKEIGSASISATSAKRSAAGIAKKIKYTSLLDICNSDSRPTGITIAIGHEQTTNNSDTSRHAVAIYPMTLATENSVLGTADHPWDMIADVIQCNTLDVLEGNLSAKNMFMYESGSPAGDETPGYNLVATQFWVRAQLQDVYAQIKDAAAGGSSAGKTARSAAKGLGNALNTLGKLVELLSGYKFYYSMATYDSGKFTMPYLDFSMAWTEITAEGAGEESVPKGGGTGGATPGQDNDVLNLSGRTIPASANGSLYGSIWEYMNGSFLTGVGLRLETGSLILSSTKKAAGTTSNPGGTGDSGKPEDGTGISLSHTHKPEFTAPSGTSGTVELTIGDADFSKTTSDKASFNVVDTSWFKALAIKVGNTNNSSSAVNVFSLQDANNNVIGSKTFSCTLVENVSAKTVTLTSNGNTIGTVSTAKTYAAGWAAAIAHAKSKAYVSGGGSGRYNLTEHKLSAGATLTNTSKDEWSYFKGNVTITGGGAGDIDWSKVSSTPV